MAKIAMLLPSSDMSETAMYAAQLYHLELSTLAILSRNTISSTAKAAILNGADIIIARGGQAISIKNEVEIPVVEIKLTSYEISLLLEQARLLTPKERPFIALTGPDNMFVDMDIPMFEKQYDIRFRPYFFHDPQEISDAAQSAIDDGADVLIGGEDIFLYCQDKNVPCLRTFSGREGILEACRIAALIVNALEQQKSYSASLNMLLDHTYSGIIQTDCNGLVVRVNHFVEHLLFMDSKNMEQQPIWNLIPGISETLIKKVFDMKKELHSANIRHGRSWFVVSISPIVVEDSVTGTIISFHEGRHGSPEEKQHQENLKRQGHTAHRTFESMIARSPQMQQLCAQAKHYSSFRFPILILGPEGTEKMALAESIHNYSTYKDYPFICFRCGNHSPEETERLLFSSYAENKDMDEASPGLLYGEACTVYLHDVHCLSLRAQLLLLNYIRGLPISIDVSSLHSPRERVRLIVSSSLDLMELVEKGQFHQNLYYDLSVSVLMIPPLRERREDIMGWIDYHLKELQKNYGRYLKLTKDGQRFLETYDWPGNLMEMVALCNRIMVNCPQYYVDAPQIEAQLDIRPAARDEPPSPSAPQVDSKGELIEQVLKRHGGNREDAAAELGVSTTTLWRWMKKYRIPKDMGKNR